MVIENCKKIEPVVVKLCSKTKYTTFFLNTVYSRLRNVMLYRKATRFNYIILGLRMSYRWIFLVDHSTVLEATHFLYRDHRRASLYLHFVRFARRRLPFGTPCKTKMIITNIGRVQALILFSWTSVSSLLPLATDSDWNACLLLLLWSSPWSSSTLSSSS